MATHTKLVEKTIKRHPALIDVLCRFSLCSPTRRFKYLTLNVERMDRGMLDGVSLTEKDLFVKKERHDTSFHMSVFFLTEKNTVLKHVVHVDERPCVFAEHISLSGKLKVGECSEVTGIVIVSQNRFFKQDVLVDCHRMTEYAQAGGAIEATLYLPPKEGFGYDNSEFYYQKAADECKEDALLRRIRHSQESFEKNVEIWRLATVLEENGLRSICGFRKYDCGMQSG